MSYHSTKVMLIVCMILSITNLAHSKKVSDLPDVLVPNMIAVDKNQLYISDRYAVLIYNLNHLEQPPEKIGRKGDGPGEFRNKPNIQFFHDSIFIHSGFKCSFYSKKGELIEEKRYPSSCLPVIQIGKVGTGYAVRRWIFGFPDSYDDISILDQNFKKIKDIYHQKMPKPDLSSPYPLLRPRIRFQCYQDKVFIADAKKGFYIEIFDNKGNILRVINRDYKKIKLNDAYRRKTLEEFKNLPGVRKHWRRFKNRKFSYPEFFPPFRDLCVSDDRIYVKKYGSENGKEKYVILDFKGNLIKTIFLPAASERLFSVNNNMFYYIAENEDGEVWELHSVRIE